MGELSKLVFSSILSTCEEYRQSFTHTSMISGFVVWAMLEIQAFGGMIREREREKRGKERKRKREKEERRGDKEW